MTPPLAHVNDLPRFWSVSPEFSRFEREETPPRAASAGQSAPCDLSAEALQRERLLISQREFSPALRSWVEAYSAVGERSLYLWQWCRHGVELTTLPCVPPAWREDVCEAKFLGGMLNVLLDDVADRQGDRRFLTELFKITAGSTPDLDGFDEEQRACGEFVLRVRQEFWERVRRYPCFEVFEELLHYDLDQLFNTIRYSGLLNRNLSMLNVAEHDLYSSQGMMLMAFATLDLMCSPSFQVHELGRLREAISHVQWMGRIGNLLSTWQREIADGDFTSGVFARAVISGDLKTEDLVSRDAERIAAAIRRGGHEDYFLERWVFHRTCLRSLRPHIRSLDVEDVVQGAERLLQTELCSRGLK